MAAAQGGPPLPPAGKQAVAKRARQAAAASLTAAKRFDGRVLTPQEMLDDVNTKLSMIFSQIDEVLIARVAATNPRDLTYLLRGLFEMRQLLSGEPTSIVSLRDVERLDNRCKELYGEIKRLGLQGEVVDLDISEYEVVEGT